MQEARNKLDDEKKAAKERHKELQRYETEKRELEKVKAGQMLAMKEVEHRVARFHKHSQEATAKVCK